MFEVFPPFVDTDMTKGFDAEKLSSDEVVQDIEAAKLFLHLLHQILYIGFFCNVGNNV